MMDIAHFSVLQHLLFYLLKSLPCPLFTLQPCSRPSESGFFSFINSPLHSRPLDQSEQLTEALNMGTMWTLFWTPTTSLRYGHH